ncbi:uncharacterized protein LOC108088837 [Drosophila ficusphila]|uniref:uncharacterized protein LOC108088837 n=1 Tax=Drosophila ficusphila TaxID=30025 RepID=UPI0007E5D510|nr:uncharacterized protein LOC108088837 [Drosophila ficusphila]
MFESISFLFLIALAFVAWVLLCFQHVVQIRTRGFSDYRVEIYTERPGIAFEPHQCHRPLDQTPSGGTYEFALSFGVIFALTFGLSKLLQLAEVQAKSYLKCREALPSVSVSQTEKLASEKRLPDQESQLNPFEQLLDPNVDFREQISVLQSQCLEMRELLQELRISSTGSRGSFLSAQSGNEVSRCPTSDEPMVVWKRAESLTETLSGTSNSERVTQSERSQPSQNIYITNSHIHINGRVLLAENNVNVDLRRRASMYTRKQSEFLQVCGKERPMIAGMRYPSILM